MPTLPIPCSSPSFTLASRFLLLSSLHVLAYSSRRLHQPLPIHHQPVHALRVPRLIQPILSIGGGAPPEVLAGYLTHFPGD
ncbi:hypothetical protein EI94DRAFT_1749254 [Lactarius quietus]|nr:hypothetical protein EI94DRAFT_1749254 [Lactarius quietus]